MILPQMPRKRRTCLADYLFPLKEPVFCSAGVPAPQARFEALLGCDQPELDRKNGQPVGFYDVAKVVPVVKVRDFSTML